MCLSNLVRVSEVTDDIHQCVFCVSVFYVFLQVAYLYMQLSLFSIHSVSFVVLRMFSFLCPVLLYLYIFEGLFLFGLCERSASAGFFGEPPFFVSTWFTYLELLCLRYFFSYAVFISACFNLRYRSGRGLLV